MKVLNPEELELLNRQGLCEDIRNKLSPSNTLVYLVLEYFGNKDLTEDMKKSYVEFIKNEAQSVQNCTNHIIATLDHTLSLPDEKIPNLVRGKNKK